MQTSLGRVRALAAEVRLGLAEVLPDLNLQRQVHHKRKSLVMKFGQADSWSKPLSILA